jgi:hypothetical protein
MRQSMSRMSSAILELILPSAQAQACNPAYCQTSGSRHRCCHFCRGIGTVCTPYGPGTCKTHTCFN